MIPEKRPKYSRTRSRRLRKKLRMDEFREFGFEATFRLNKQILAKQSEEVFYAFIDKMEAAKLSCGGGGTVHKLNLFIMRERGASAIEEDRIRVLEAINSLPEVTQVYIGPLMDANYPDEP
jgi:uncharacterized protein YggL (DUF469 family)